MRTEAEFLQLVEGKLTAAPKRSLPTRKAALTVAIAAVLFCTVFVGIIMYRPGRANPPPDTGTAPFAEAGSPETAHTAAEIATTPAVNPAQSDTALLADTVTPAETSAKSAHTAKLPETAICFPAEYPVSFSITYNGIVYDAFFSSDTDKAPLTAADLGDAIGKHLYALAGVSTDYMIVFEHDGTLWRYLNRWYRPASMAAFIADLNLTENLQIGSLYYEAYVDGKYRSWRVDGLDQARLWDMLFSYPNSEPQELWIKIDPEAMVKEAAEQGIIVSPPYDPTGRYTYPRTPIPALSFSISLPKFGYHNISIQISDEDNGWLWTNILVSGNYFATSPDLVDDVMAYAQTAGEWIDTTPAYKLDTTKIPETDIPAPATVTVESTKAIG